VAQTLKTPSIRVKLISIKVWKSNSAERAGGIGFYLLGFDAFNVQPSPNALP